MSPEELAAVRHRENKRSTHADVWGHCFADDEQYPCEKIQMLDALEATEAELTAERAKVERVREMHRGDHQCIKAGMPWRYLPLEQCPTMRALDGAA